MVSKRRNVSEDEPGTSKKRIRTKDKSQVNLDLPEQLPSNKKKTKRQTKAKQPEISTEAIAEVKSELVVGSEAIADEDIQPQKPIDPISGVPNWPVEHMSELLRRMECILPQKDQLLYKSRADKINWDDIAFNDYSGAQCRLMWDSIQKRLRRFRILRELVEDAKLWINKPWTNFYRGNKTNRHPDMPRRPLSTYMIFYMKKKDKVLKENPGLEMTDLSKYMGELYKKLSPKSKEKYFEMAAIQRREYDTKMEEFCRLHPELSPHNKSNLFLQNDAVPKKPPTPFKLFYEDKVKRHEHDTNFEKTGFIDCKDQWKNMSDKKKVFWINWALEKEAKYLEDLKKYQADNPNFIPGPQKSILTKEERIIRERMAGKPEKPPNSAYSLFSRLMLASDNVKTVSPKERMFLIAQQWKNCSSIEKKEYSDRVKHMLEQYKLQYAEYLESLPEDKRQEELLKNQPKKKKPAKAAKASASSEDNTRNRTKWKKNKEKNPVKLDDTASIKTGLYEGEPEPPPATPYLLFVKSYQDSYPDRHDALQVWNNMDEEQRNFHRRVLWDLKRVYIESYENFLKGLTQQELKEYSEWKKTAKLAGNESEDVSDNIDSYSEECSSDTDSEYEVKVKEEKGNQSDSDSSSTDS